MSEKRYFKRKYDGHMFVTHSIANPGKGNPAETIYNLQPLRKPRTGWGTGPWYVLAPGHPTPVTQQVIDDFYTEVAPPRLPGAGGTTTQAEPGPKVKAQAATAGDEPAETKKTKSKKSDG